MTGSLAPIALFVYNRPEHTRLTLEALRRNPGSEQSRLYVFADGPRASAAEGDQQQIEKVRNIVRAEQWCGEIEIIESGTNVGLARAIRNGIDTVLRDHEHIIVLEDDLETSPGFLAYMNAGLATYRHSSRVMAISSFLPSTSYSRILPQTFFLRHLSCWGWGTWATAWRQAKWDAKALLEELSRVRGADHAFNLDGACDFKGQLTRNLNGELDTWAVFWAATIFLAGGLVLHPCQSLIQNHGVDGSGTNFSSNQTGRYQVELAKEIIVQPVDISESRVGRWYLKSFHRYGTDSRLNRRLRLQLGRLKHRVARKLGMLRP